MKKNFIITVSLFVVSVILPAFVHCQSTKNIDDYLERLPGQLKPDYSTPRKYLMTTDYADYDLFGNFIKKMRISGECTLGLNDGYIRWNNVKISHSQKLNEPYPDGERQSAMENFTYEPSEDILSESFFKKIPQADPYMINLIWDMSMFETFAWYKWDSLKLNTDFLTNDINSKIKLPGIGTFENKDVRITWTGITRTNNKPCAIIKYTAMNNPLDMSFQNYTMKGRSHYWGSIYVSLSDKQIESGELYEDVLMDIKMDGQEPGSKVNTVRYISLKKVL
jgi:hypothetical protein